ncbi:maleylacetoacetate isomerase [Pseudoalteromonas sp. MM17-2]|uniref:maleylacetoacetate isomerase n=1 Tax=Pseudoalteromonas sp. MM17-2 TaxID=2917753 RepID=UPI001EF5E4A4|nr:maleylacetoacetate isomerase [Pseudoalteromonas sp. MM17-2]MCG7545986.1 maleylacetoacetate isomerase [Pseudoalteromonas sp. MM17-2]
MKLYSYFRSSAAYRVRIALNLKELEHDIVPVNLLKSEQRGEPYLSKNPQGLLPAIETEQGVLSQSLAILEWLDEIAPQAPLVRGDAWEKAQIRALAYAIAVDIHPINNLRVLKYLTAELNVSDEQKTKWYQDWIVTGFDSLENQIGEGPFCFGSAPTLADICLVPQVFNALRFKVDMDRYPKIMAVYEHCNTLKAFADAAPQQQVDAT